METESVVLVEHVLVVEELSKGVSDEGAVVDGIPSKDLVLVTVMEQEAVITEEDILPAMEGDQMEIEKSTLMLQALPTTSGYGDGDGDGKAPAPEVKRAPSGVSQAAEMVTEPCEEVGQAAFVVKEQGGCNGDGEYSDGKAPPAEENRAPLGAPQAAEMVTEPCDEVGQAALVVAKEQDGCDDDGKAPAVDDNSLPEFLPVPENNEPLWGDVPDAIPVEPILPPRPPKRPRVAPECVEVDDVVQTMRNILFNLTYEDDAHLSPEDETKVRDLLEYHPNAEEKTGSGIDFIKIKRHSTYKDARCFWVVRTDGTETDFSYHKCLKMKVAKENPSFVDRYDAIYRAPKRPRMV